MTVTPTSSVTKITDLPDFVVPQITGRLTIRDHLSFSQACKSFRQYIPNVTIPRGSDGKIICFNTIEAIQKLVESTKPSFFQSIFKIIPYLNQIEALAYGYMKTFDGYVLSHPLRSVQAVHDNFILGVRVVKELTIMANHLKSGKIYKKIVNQIIDLVGKTTKEGVFCEGLLNRMTSKEIPLVVFNDQVKINAELLHHSNPGLPYLFDSLNLIINHGEESLMIERDGDGLFADFEVYAGCPNEVQLNRGFQLGAEVLLREKCRFMEFKFRQISEELNPAAAASGFSIVSLQRAMCDPLVENQPLIFLGEFSVVMRIEIDEVLVRWIKTNNIKVLFEGDGPIFPVQREVCARIKYD